VPIPSERHLALRLLTHQGTPLFFSFFFNLPIMEGMKNFYHPEIKNIITIATGWATHTP